MSIKILLISCACPEPSSPSLGVTSIATHLLSKGIETRVFDDGPYMLDIADVKTDPRELILSVQKTDSMQLYRLDYDKRFSDLLAMVKEFKPDLIGASSTEATFYNAIAYFKKIKECHPNIKTMLGGAFAILAPDIAIAQESVDMVALGEGETILEEYCMRSASDDNPIDTKGIWAKDPDGKIHKNAMSELTAIDKTPPLKFDLYPAKRLLRPISGAVRRMLPLEVSRGCMYNCTYCGSSGMASKFKLQGNWNRFKSIESIEEAIGAYVKLYRPEYFFVISETFLAMKDDYFDRFIRMYGKFKVPFWMNTRPETISEDRIMRLKEVGLERVSVGVECGNESYRRERLNRKHSNALLIKVFEILRKYDLKTSANVMIGLPDETRELIFDSIRLVKLLKASGLGLAIYQPYKGTALYNHVIEKGYYDPAKIADTTCYTPSIFNPNLSNKEIMKFLYIFNLYVKMDEAEWPKLDSIDLETERGWPRLKELLEQYASC